MDDHNMEKVKKVNKKRSKPKKEKSLEEKRQKLIGRRSERKYQKGLKAFRRAYGPPVPSNTQSGTTPSDTTPPGVEISVDSLLISQPAQHHPKSQDRHNVEAIDAARERGARMIGRGAQNKQGEGEFMDVDDKRAYGFKDNHENPSATKESYNSRYRSESPEVRVRTWKEMCFQTGRWNGTFDL